MAAETRGLCLQVDSMQFFGDLLNEIFGESAPSSKKLHLKQNAIQWSKTIVTDARDVNDKVYCEGRTPTTEGSDTGDCHHAKKVGQLRSIDTLDSRRKHDHEWSDERSQRVNQDNTWLEYCKTENGAYKETLH